MENAVTLGTNRDIEKFLDSKLWQNIVYVAYFEPRSVEEMVISVCDEYVPKLITMKKDYAAKSFGGI